MRKVEKQEECGVSEEILEYIKDKKYITAPELEKELNITYWQALKAIEELEKQGYIRGFDGRTVFEVIDREV